MKRIALSANENKMDYSPKKRLNIKIGKGVLVKKQKKPTLSGIKIKYKDFELNRYKYLDQYFRRILACFGEDKLFFIFRSSLLNFLPGLKLISALSLVRSKKINETPDVNIYKYLSKFNLRYINYALGDWLLKHRNYGEITEKHFQKAYHKNRDLNVNLRYSDYISQKYGYKSPKLKLIIARLSSIDVYRNLNNSQKMRLAIILYQAGKDTQANQILRRLGKAYIIKSTSSPYIYNKLLKHSVFSDPYIRRGDEQYKAILKARKEFCRRILLASNDFCIVGNSPSEHGRNNGSVIDSKSLVIRINNYSLDYPDDYGTKQDVWVRVTNNEVTENHLRNNSLVIFAANNFAIKRKDAGCYLLPPYLMDKSYTIIPNHIYRALIDKLDGLPSTGLAIAYWIYTIIGKLPRESLFGFSHLYENADFKKHYYDDQVKIGTHLHEWDRERIIFNAIIK